MLSVVIQLAFSYKIIIAILFCGKRNFLRQDKNGQVTLGTPMTDDNSFYKILYLRHVLIPSPVSFLQHLHFCFIFTNDNDVVPKVNIYP